MQKRKRSNFACSLADRNITGSRISQQPWLRHFSCEGSFAGTVLVHPHGVGTPPFAIEYSQVLNNQKYLAVADEEGYVSILDTTKPLPRGLHDEGATPAQWLAHHNAIFDVTWCQKDSQMLTASGDQTLALWDTGRASCLGVFKGHHGSVKCVRAKPDCPEVFASGARDGALMVWDSREVARWDADRGVAINTPVMVMNDAHKYVSCATDSARKRRKQVESKQSVTSALFLHGGQVLASAGAGDGMVKFWDLRKTDKPSWQLSAPSPGSTPQVVTPTPRTTSKMKPFVEIPSVYKSKHPHGVTCLAQDPLGSRLLVSVGNSVHYLYDTLRPSIGPTAAFTGHVMSSFFIKACFSPDGTHILSGSSDKNAYIWQVDAPYAKPFKLQGHEREVTAVAWCPTDPHSIATCGDDATVKLWNVQQPWPPAPGPSPEETTVSTDAVGLATTDWLSSPPPTTPSAAPQPISQTLAENPAAVAAAVNRENMLHSISGAGQTGLGAAALPGSAVKLTGARNREPGTPFTPEPHPQGEDALTLKAEPHTVAPSSRKKQRSIHDFFMSPPVLPSAKRLKKQPQVTVSAHTSATPNAQHSAPQHSATHHSAAQRSAAHESESEQAASASHDSTMQDSSAQPSDAHTCYSCVQNPGTQDRAAQSAAAQDSDALGVSHHAAAGPASTQWGDENQPPVREPSGDVRPLADKSCAPSQQQPRCHLSERNGISPGCLQASSGAKCSQQLCQHASLRLGKSRGYQPALLQHEAQVTVAAISVTCQMPRIFAAKSDEDGTRHGAQMNDDISKENQQPSAMTSVSIPA